MESPNCTLFPRDLKLQAINKHEKLGGLRNGVPQGLHLNPMNLTASTWSWGSEEPLVQ
jgi:hypothetical protein